jgi:hypothetical protein
MDWRGALLNDHNGMLHLKEELPCGGDVWRGFQVLLWVLQDATLGLPHLRRHRADACKNTRECGRQELQTRAVSFLERRSGRTDRTLTLGMRAGLCSLNMNYFAIQFELD